MHVEDDLLDTSFDLMDKKGILAAKMKIVLSRISGSGDNTMEEFMSSLPTSLSTLGHGLELTMHIMDRFSKVGHLSRLYNSKLADRGD